MDFILLRILNCKVDYGLLIRDSLTSSGTVCHLPLAPFGLPSEVPPRFRAWSLRTLKGRLFPERFKLMGLVKWWVANLPYDLYIE